MPDSIVQLGVDLIKGLGVSGVVVFILVLAIWFLIKLYCQERTERKEWQDKAFDVTRESLTATSGHISILGSALEYVKGGR